MRKNKRTIIAVGVVLVAAVTGTGAALASSDDESGSRAYTPQQATAATEAALEATGGGTANSVERDSEDGATWEVEVARPDGSVVDVRLDRRYQVVVIEGDSDRAEPVDR